MTNVFLAFMPKVGPNCRSSLSRGIVQNTVTCYRDTIESLLSPSRSEGWVPYERSMAFRGEGDEFDAERGNSIIRGPRFWHASGSTSASVPSQKDRRKIPKPPRGKWSVPWFDSRNKIHGPGISQCGAMPIAPDVSIVDEALIAAVPKLDRKRYIADTRDSSPPLPSRTLNCSLSFKEAIKNNSV